MAALQYKAIIFDVTDTLRDGHGPRSETLIETLQNLKARCVQLFAVSSVAGGLVHYGFLEGLIIPVMPHISNGKVGGVKQILDEHDFKPEECLYFGDCRYEDRHAAEDNGVRFILVTPYFYTLGNEVSFEIEKHLADIFGKEILGKKPEKKERVAESTPQLIIDQPKEELPLPKQLKEPPKEDKERFARTKRVLRALHLMKRN